MKRYLSLWLSFILVTAIIITVFTQQTSAEPLKAVYTIHVNGYIINPAVEEYIIKSIKAAQTKSQCLIIYLDTPGGLLNSTRNIVKEIMNSKIPIVVYVAPQGARAGSAGVFITLAAHITCMAPSTNIGAAHPVQVGGEGNSFSEAIKELIRYLRGRSKAKEGLPIQKEKTEKDILSQKIMNDTLAWVTTIAQARNRDIEWAKKTVSESISTTENEALKRGIADFIAADGQELLANLDGRSVTVAGKHQILHTKDAPVERIDMTARQGFLNIIANPTLAYILMLLGFYGLLFEFTHPGIGFPGIAGTISIILGFYGLHTLPTSYAGLALIFLGIILFIAETQVASFGLLTLGGIVSMLLGSLMLIDSPYEVMHVSIKVILPFVLTTAGITVFLLSRVVRAHRRKVTSGKEGLIGTTAEVLKDIKGNGKVFVHGEIWQAKSDNLIRKGEETEIIGIEGMKLIVKKKGR